MKQILFIIILFAASSFSVEEELHWDVYVSGYTTSPEGYYYRMAMDFTPNYQCHLSKIKLYPSTPPTSPLGNSTWAYIYNDNAGLPGTIIGQKFYNTIIAGWNTLDIADQHIIINQNEKFYVAFLFGATPEIINCCGYDSNQPIHGWFYSTDNGNTWQFWTNQDRLIRAIIDSDMNPPYVNGQVPVPQSNVNPPLNSLVFHCRDADKGVDPDTIVFTCTGNGNPIPGTLDKDTSDLHDVICTFTPTNPIGAGVCVLCNVHSGLADGLGNATTSDITWWFTVGGNKVRTNSLGELKAIFHQ
jgi:hypothetical protein